jgi:hypothetical protein
LMPRRSNSVLAGNGGRGGVVVVIEAGCNSVLAGR